MATSLSCADPELPEKTSHDAYQNLSMRAWKLIISIGKKLDYLKFCRLTLLMIKLDMVQVFLQLRGS